MFIDSLRCSAELILVLLIMEDVINLSVFFGCGKDANGVSFDSEVHLTRRALSFPCPFVDSTFSSDLDLRQQIFLLNMLNGTWKIFLLDFIFGQNFGLGSFWNSYLTGRYLVKSFSIFSLILFEWIPFDESLEKYRSLCCISLSDTLFELKTVSLYFIFICWIVARSAKSSWSCKCKNNQMFHSV